MFAVLVLKSFSVTGLFYCKMWCVWWNSFKRCDVLFSGSISLLLFPPTPPVLSLSLHWIEILWYQKPNETTFLALTQQKISESQIPPKFFQINFLIFANYVQHSSLNFYVNLIRMFGIAAYLIWPPSLRQIDYNDNLSFEFLNRKLDVFQYLSLTRPHSDLILDFFS